METRIRWKQVRVKPPFCKQKNDMDDTSSAQWNHMDADERIEAEEWKSFIWLLNPRIHVILAEWLVSLDCRPTNIDSWQGNEAEFFLVTERFYFSNRAFF